MEGGEASCLWSLLFSFKASAKEAAPGVFFKGALHMLCKQLPWPPPSRGWCPGSFYRPLELLCWLICKPREGPLGCSGKDPSAKCPFLIVLLPFFPLCACSSRLLHFCKSLAFVKNGNPDLHRACMRAISLSEGWHVGKISLCLNKGTAAIRGVVRSQLANVAEFCCSWKTFLDLNPDQLVLNSNQEGPGKQETD